MKELVEREWRRWSLDGIAAKRAADRRRRTEEENASERLVRRGVDGAGVWKIIPRDVTDRPADTVLRSFWQRQGKALRAAATAIDEHNAANAIAAAAHIAFRARRDASEGHLWARNAGALEVTVTCSDGEISRWPRLDTAQSSSELELAIWWATDRIGSWLPADATEDQLAEFAHTAMSWARSRYDHYGLADRAEQGPAPKPRKTTRVPTLAARVTAGCKREPTPWSEIAPILEPLTSSECLRASLDPQRPPTAVLALEHAATAFLAAHGEHWPRPDVFDRAHRRHLARTDPIAHAAQVRFKLPSPVVVHSGEAVDDDTTLADHGYTLSHLPVTLTPTPREKLTGARRGWIGHEFVRFYVQPDREITRKITRIERAEITTTKRGPAVSPWECSERSVRRQVQARDDLAAAATAIADVLRTTTVGTDVPLEGGAVVTVVGVDAVAWSGTTWRMVEWSRRAALAGLTID